MNPCPDLGFENELPAEFDVIGEVLIFATEFDIAFEHCIEQVTALIGPVEVDEECSPGRNIPRRNPQGNRRIQDRTQVVDVKVDRASSH